MAAAKTANRCDVLAIGSDLAVFAAALDCARIGLKVDLWIPKAEENQGPANFSHRGGVVAGLLDELGVPYEIVIPAPGEEEICGIPGNPFSLRVRKALGWGGAWRVYLDRIKPVLTIGTEPNLGKLVRTRMGDAALEKLVNPVVLERYGLPAVELTVDSVAPGLSQGMTRGGSLSNGVLELIAEDARIAQRVVVPGGVEAITAAAVAKLEYFAATVTRVSDPTKKLATGYKKAGVVLADFGEVELPEGIDTERVAEVGMSSENPGLERAIPASQHAALSMRRVLLSDPEKPPVGTLSFEG
jgi:oxygen-dependent protoporphyrinogen oxidase